MGDRKDVVPRSVWRAGVQEGAVLALLLPFSPQQLSPGLAMAPIPEHPPTCPVCPSHLTSESELLLAASPLQVYGGLSAGEFQLIRQTLLTFFQDLHIRVSDGRPRSTCHCRPREMGCHAVRQTRAKLAQLVVSSLFGSIMINFIF